MSHPAAMNSGRPERRTLPSVVALTLNGAAPTRKLHATTLGSGVVSPASTPPWWQQRVEERRSARRGRRNVLIVGAGPLGREAAAALQLERGEMTVVGFLDDYAAGANNVLGRVSDLARVARLEFVDEVIVAVPDPVAARLAVREARRNRLDIRMVPSLHECVWSGDTPAAMVLEDLGGLPLLTLHREKIASAALAGKRLFDVTLSALALLLLAPLMAGIALAIRLTSPGQALYRAQRVGLKGRKFVCYKFRTMVANADGLKDNLRRSNERQGPCFKMADDPALQPG
jgi:hypothetical protein